MGLYATCHVRVLLQGWLRVDVGVEFGSREKALVPSEKKRKCKKRRSRLNAKADGCAVVVDDVAYDWLLWLFA